MNSGLMNHATPGTTMLAPGRLLPAVISTYVGFAEENTEGLNASKIWVPNECCASQETVRFLGFTGHLFLQKGNTLHVPNRPLSWLLQL
jgi:hypothetical protein